MTGPALLDGPRLAPKEGKADALVVLLHGYGSNGADLIGLAPMWQRLLPAAAFVAPDAPQRVPGYPGGHQWWPLASFDPAALAAGAAAATPVLDAFLDAELARAGLAADRLVLLGFSQGTMMALQVGLRRTQRIAAIIGYSGALADVGSLDAELRTRPPILLVHGAADPVVPAMAMTLAERRLTALGCTVETRLTPRLEHSVDADGIAAGAAFARAALGAAAA